MTAEAIIEETVAAARRGIRDPDDWIIDTDRDTGEPICVRHATNPRIGTASYKPALVSAGCDGIVGIGRQWRTARAALLRARKVWQKHCDEVATASEAVKPRVRKRRATA